MSKARAYSYLRFSSPEQAKGASKRRQIEAAARWAKENDLELDEQLKDEGVSAFRGKHRDPTSALGKFLERVRKGDVAKGSFLLIESFDRLSREQVVDALELFLSLTRDGITIVTLVDGQTYNRASLSRDSTQLIISIIIMSRAYEESATKSRRVGDAWSRKREAARQDQQAMTSRCPGWIQLVGGPRKGHYELIPERAAIVAEIFESAIAGDGRRTITKRLNARGMEPWGMGRSRGKFWHDSYVTKIIQSAASFGRYDKGADQIAGYFPAAISEGTYWQAQAATKSRTIARGKVSRGFSNLLKDLACCSACGGSMAYIDKGKRGKPYLRCVNTQAGHGCDRRKSVPYAPLEDIVAYGYAHFADAAMFALNEVAKAAEIELESLKAQREAVAARRQRLVDAIAEGVALDVVRGTLDTATAELATLDAKISDATSLCATQSDALNTDVDDRRIMIWNRIYHPEPEIRYQGRAWINARLRTFLQRLEITADGQVYYQFRPEYANIDVEMRRLYNLDDEADEEPQSDSTRRVGNML